MARAAQRRLNVEQAALTNLAVQLYESWNLSSTQISTLTGIPDRTVRDRLRARGRADAYARTDQ